MGLWGLDYREGGWRLWPREREACPVLSGFSGSWPQRRRGDAGQSGGRACGVCSVGKMGMNVHGVCFGWSGENGEDGDDDGEMALLLLVKGGGQRLVFFLLMSEE